MAARVHLEDGNFRLGDVGEARGRDAPLHSIERGANEERAAARPLLRRSSRLAAPRSRQAPSPPPRRPSSVDPAGDIPDDEFRG